LRLTQSPKPINVIIEKAKQTGQPFPMLNRERKVRAPPDRMLDNVQEGKPYGK